MPRGGGRRPKYAQQVLPDIMGVIYGGTGTPHFLDLGVLYPHFQDEKVKKNFLSPAVSVNRGELWKLNYNKTVFGWGSRFGGVTSSPFSSPLVSGPKGASFSF